MITTDLIEKSLRKLSADDQKLVMRARDMKFTNGCAGLTMWDFADTLLVLCGGAPRRDSEVVKAANAASIVATFVERSERQKELRERKVKSAVSKKEASELEGCTFRPDLDVEKLSATHARYLDPKPVRPPHVAKPEDAEGNFAVSLRDHRVIRCRSIANDALTLSEEVRKRLDGAELFHADHKERMRELRINFRSLLEKERVQYA